ncbi:hypothetical protein ACFQX7_23665 [Luedemannella flava]
MEAFPRGPYGPMKKPSGSANRALAAAAQRIASGCAAVGSGTGTRTPPSGTHSRQWPLLMNVGTGSRSVVATWRGRIGTSAATTAAGTTKRTHGVRCASARPMP